MYEKKGSHVFIIVLLILMSMTFNACKKTEDPDNKSTTGTKTNASASSKKSNAATTTKTSAVSTTKNDTTLTDNDTVDEQNPDNENNIPENDDPGPVEEDPVNESEDEIYDLGGRTITIAVWGTAPKEEHTPEEYNSGSLVFYGTKEMYLRFKEAEEKYNFKYVFRHNPSGVTMMRDEFLSEILAGLHFADAFRAQTQYAFPMYLLNKSILPVDEYYDFETDRFKLKENPYLIPAGTWNDRVYALTEQVGGWGNGVIFNKDIFEREGLESPVVIARRGEWDWQHFTDACISLMRDFDGDGIIDQMALASGYEVLGMCFIHSNGGRLMSFDENGRAIYGLDDIKALRGVTYYSELLNTYKVGVGNYQTFFDGKAGMLIAAYTHNRSCWATRDMNTALVPFPKGPDVDNNQNVSTSATFYVFPSTTSHPKEIINIIAEIISTWDESRPNYIDINQTLYNSFNYQCQDPENEVDIWIKYAKQVQFDPFQGVPGYQIDIMYNQLFLPVAQGQTSVKSLIDAQRPNAQALLDSYINDQMK